MEVRGKTVLVVGAGVSGLAVCKFLLAHQAQVILADSRELPDLSKELAVLVRQGVRLYLGNFLPAMVDWDLVVTSPGVPPMIPLLSMSRAAGVEVIGEVELAYRFSQATFVGITGTNGKTTTTSLIHYIFEHSGVDARIGGNIGVPVIGFAEDYHGLIVTELSSFQLESCDQFRPHIAVYLNLTPDHLDRHGTFDAYREAKERIFAHQQAEDYAVLNYDDPVVANVAQRIAAKAFYFSLHQVLPEGAYYQEGNLYISDGGKKQLLLPADAVFIKGQHNLQNALAAAACTYLQGVAIDEIAEALRIFPGVEHRLEVVTEQNHILYVNDSKATNPDSTEKALLSFDQPIILIAGGFDKGSDFSPLMDLIQQKVKRMIILGESLPAIKRAADQVGYRDYQLADSFDEAVALAQVAAEPGDVVLLSPACASWDMFKNFEERGRRFKELVLAKQA